MTGYKAPPSTFLIRFEDRPGLEVVMRKISIGRLIDMMGLADSMTAGKTTAEQATELFTEFTGRLVSWNLIGDDDQPVPSTLEGVRSLDPDLFIDIFRGWSDGMTRPPKASPAPSSNGHQDVAALPMTVLPVS